MNHTSAAHRAVRTLRRAAAATVFAGLAASGAGCSLFQTGVLLNDAPPTPTTRPATATKSPSPADVMFTSDGPALTKPANSVNVFGEVDGVSQSPFEGQARTGGLQQHTFVDEGYDADPAISPDGQWLLFASTRHSEHADLYLQHTDGLAVTQLTSDDADDAYPRFSRDGKQIAFASNRAGNWDIYVMEADGSRLRQLTRSPAQELHPTFSPDGTRVVYASLGTRSGQWELWTIDLRTNERRMIGYGLFPDWSPRTDRDVIAFQKARQRGSRWFSIWTLELVDGEPREVTEVAYSRTSAAVAPTWNAAGTRLAFCTIKEPENAPAAKKGGSLAKGAREDVWSVNDDGTDRRMLTDGRGVNASPIWGNDGRIYFISDRAGSESIWSMSAEAFGDGVSSPKTAASVKMPDVVDPFESKQTPPAHHPSRQAAPIVETPIEAPAETHADAPAAEKPPQAEVTTHEPPTDAPLEAPIEHEEAAHGEPAKPAHHASAHE